MAVQLPPGIPQPIPTLVWPCWQSSVFGSHPSLCNPSPVSISWPDPLCHPASTSRAGPLRSLKVGTIWGHFRGGHHKSPPTILTWACNSGRWRTPGQDFGSQASSHDPPPNSFPFRVGPGQVRVISGPGRSGMDQTGPGWMGDSLDPTLDPGVPWTRP